MDDFALSILVKVNFKVDFNQTSQPFIKYIILSQHSPLPQGGAQSLICNGESKKSDEVIP